MTVSSNVTTAEMREAFRLNLNATLIWKLARTKLRPLATVLAFIAIVIVDVKNHGVTRQGTGVFGGMLALLIVVLLVSLHRTIARTAKAINKLSSMLTIDASGLTDAAANGVRTSVPWSAITRWREGKLVYTLGDAKTFRTVSKNTLGEVQSGELRSLLLSQIR